MEDEVREEYGVGDAYKQKLWMVRNCEMYEDEYKDCKSFRSRLHQYFVYGSLVDCSQWKRDYDSCEKWTVNKNKEALEELIKSEVIRRKERLQPHFDNDVWEKRDHPPQEWNDPLPEWIQNKLEYSYFNMKSKEKKEGVEPKRTFCVIS